MKAHASHDEIDHGLPGGEVLRAGLIDVAAGRKTVAACLVWIAAPRLMRHALLPDTANVPEEPERQLYGLLKAEGGDAYGRYNSYLRLLTSFERALDRRRHRPIND